jgi:probable F420-dependent oxidoreductase
MDRIEFGITLRPGADAAASAREAEARGFDFVAAGEHVFFSGPIDNGLIALAAAAAVTERIRLVSMVTLVPLYPAALLAKLTAGVDVASHGRFELGVGVGGEFAKEFEACGVPVEERGARTNEALELLLRLWTERDVHFEGRWNRLSGVTLEPPPVRKPHPPIWIAGRSEAAMRRAARFGDGWFPYFYTPEMLASSLARIAEHQSEIGREPRMNVGVDLFCTVHERRETALAMAAERLGPVYDQDFSKVISRYAVAGTPAECQARIREYIDAGARSLLIDSVCPEHYEEENWRRLLGEVLPVFRD